MSDADPRIVRRLNAIIVLLLVPYVAGAVVLVEDAFVALSIVGAIALGLLFVLAVFRTFGG